MSEGISLEAGIRQTRRLAKAITERWPISDNLRRAVIQRLTKVFLDPKASHREITSASRALIAADAVNIELEKQPEQQTQQHLHLHQHGKIDVSKIPTGELERIERVLLAATGTELGGSSSGTAEAEPV